MGIALAQVLADMPAWLLVSLALLAVVLVVLVAIAATQAQLRPSVIDPATPGDIGEALTPIDKHGGEVLINGEYWAARARASHASHASRASLGAETDGHPIPPGAEVRVVAVHGLRLTVEQLEVDHET